jgi:hypothetical protein
LCLFAAVELPDMAVDEKKPEAAAAAEATEDANGDQEGVFKGQLISEWIYVVKVKILWEGHKIEKNLPLVLTLMSKNSCFVETSGRFFSNFVAFL